VQNKKRIGKISLVFFFDMLLTWCGASANTKIQAMPAMPARVCRLPTLVLPQITDEPNVISNVCVGDDLPLRNDHIPSQK
jgi:hypothetical protein